MRTARSQLSMETSILRALQPGNNDCQQPSQPLIPRGHAAPNAWRGCFLHWRCNIWEDPPIFSRLFHACTEDYWRFSTPKTTLTPMDRYALWIRASPVVAILQHRPEWGLTCSASFTPDCCRALWHFGLSSHLPKATWLFSSPVLQAGYLTNSAKSEYGYGIWNKICD